MVTTKNEARTSQNKIDSAFDSQLNWRPLTIFFIALLSGLIHRYHVSTIFENDRHFSHLSSLEREMTFRSEMGMYYSYYKIIIEAPSFFDGISVIIKNNRTEFPNTINALERFNLLPEVVLGFMYRLFIQICDKLDIAPLQCWQVHRGTNLPPVYSCEGIRQPEYFYLEGVWAFAGLTGIVLFFYGLLISDSIFGGIITVLCFFYNHSECTRVQWTPPLRESFAYPCCLLQMYYITMVIKSNKNVNPNSCGLFSFQAFNIVLITSVCLLLWQFSQFLFATQVIVLLFMFYMEYLNRFTFNLIILCELVALLFSWLILFGNTLLKSSLLMPLLISLVFSFNIVYDIVGKYFGRKQNFLTIVVSTVLLIILKKYLFVSEDGSHITNVLWSKVSSYKDFDTLLYTCSPEFDFLGWEPITKISYSWLLPITMAVLIVLFMQWIIVSSNLVDSCIVYNVAQLIAFTVMAAFIMRLKLFFTPHLAVVASLVSSYKYFKFTRTKETHFSLLIILIGGMSVVGLKNICEQHNVMGEYSNYNLEELLTWIQDSTPPNAVFAGAMPVTSAILLSTGRSIVNHPHYENKEIREKTKKVYSIYSRKPPEEIFEILSSLSVEYVVISENWCFNHRRSEGCRHTDLWDTEESHYRHRRPTCPQLFSGTAAPFYRVFTNQEYVVLKLPSPTVEIKSFMH